jgi:hypothetical protein
MQYSEHVLNALTAPKLTFLTDCGAGEISQLPPHYESVIRLNQAVGGVGHDANERVLILNFISRLRTAISEYNQGQRFLQKYVEALPRNHLLNAHREALIHFESSILQLHVAVVSLAGLGGGTSPGNVKSGRTQLYVRGDKSDYDRLRLLCNSIKHFDEDVERATQRNVTVPIAPLWITNDGFECLKNANVSFSEMKAIFEAQTRDAESFSNQSDYLGLGRLQR